jgi:O-methyltransferase
MSAGMADVLGAGRRYYLFDSYEGMPPAQDEDGEVARAWEAATDSPVYYDNCKAEVDFAKRAMGMSVAEDVTYVQGWFSETVKDFVAPGGIAVLRLDGDWYESTMTCLRALYPQVVPGGLIIIDDYFAWDGCAKAVNEYFASTDPPERIRSAHRVSHILKGTNDPR